MCNSPFEVVPFDIWDMSLDKVSTILSHSLMITLYDMDLSLKSRANGPIP